MSRNPLLDRIARQRQRLAAERDNTWKGALPEEHGQSLLELLRLTDKLYAGRRFPPPEPRSDEAVQLWRTLVRRGHA